MKPPSAKVQSFIDGWASRLRGKTDRSVNTDECWRLREQADRLGYGINVPRAQFHLYLRRPGSPTEDQVITNADVVDPFVFARQYAFVRHVVVEER